MGSLRTLFAIAVVFAHTSFNQGYVFVGPRNAVQLFYMISGFLISYVLTNTIVYENIWRFYKSRALRLYPVYFVVAALTLVAVIVGNPKFFDFYRMVPMSSALLVGISNLTLFGQDWVMFLGLNGGQLQIATNLFDTQIPLYQGLLIPQAWTLGLELTFYALAPFILRSRKKIFALLVISLGLRVASIAFFGVGLEDPWTYRFFPFELGLFLVGALAHQLLLPFWKRSPAVEKYKLDAVATYAMVAFSLVFFLIPLAEDVRSGILFVIFPILLPLTFLFQNRTMWDRTVGELSYPIYIGHMLIVWVVGHFTNRKGNLSPLAASTIIVVVSIAFAIFLDRFVARKVEAYRQSLKVKP